MGSSRDTTHNILGWQEIFQKILPTSYWPSNLMKISHIPSYSQPANNSLGIIFLHSNPLFLQNPAPPLGQKPHPNTAPLNGQPSLLTAFSRMPQPSPGTKRSPYPSPVSNPSKSAELSSCRPNLATTSGGTRYIAEVPAMQAEHNAGMSWSEGIL